MFSKIGKSTVSVVMLTSSYALLTGCTTVSDYFSSPDVAAIDDEVQIEDASSKSTITKGDEQKEEKIADSQKEESEEKIQKEQKPVKGLVADTQNRKYEDEYERQEASVVRPLVDKKEVEQRVSQMQAPEPVSTKPVEVSKLDIQENDIKPIKTSIEIDDIEEPVEISSLKKDELQEIDKGEFETPVYASDFDKLLRQSQKQLESLAQKTNNYQQVKLIKPQAYDKVGGQYQISSFIPNSENRKGKISLVPPVSMMSPMVQTDTSNVTTYNLRSDILPPNDVETYDNSLDMAVPAQVFIDGSGAREIPEELEGISQTSGVSFLVSTIFHRHGSDNLSKKDMSKIYEAVRLAKRYGGKIRVVGHASSRTREMALTKHMMVNFDMSMNRAQEVSKVLQKIGFPEEKIYVTAVSDSEPIYYEVMPSGEAANRRTEIYLDY